MSITITATVNSKPDQQQQLKALLLELVSETKKETACLQYDLHQAIDQPEFFILHEEWESQQGLEFHENQPHITKFREASAGLIAGKLAVYKTVKL